ncbi:hypothetical protein JCM3774_006589 [Rhodotorula dairenensis]
MHRPPAVVALLLALVAGAAAALWLAATSSSSPLSAPKWTLAPDPLAYRRHIQQATTEHRRPLFDHVYVLSLPTREDRRADMRKLARALALDITFVDAADKHEPFLKWIAERVYETRQLRRQVIADRRNVDPESIGGMRIGSDWVTPFPDKMPPRALHKPASAATKLKTSPPPPPPPPPARFPEYPRAPAAQNYLGPHWVAHLEALYASGGHHTSLRPADPNLNVTSLLWDPLEPVDVRQVHEGVISTYWGQTRALKRVLENADRTALILEDDVDIEWDLESFWTQIERRLPPNDDWDVTFLGHCWGGEFQQPQYRHPLVHRSTGPMCLHGYALTATGAHRLLAALLDPWSAYSTAVDLVIPSLLHIQSRHPAFHPPPPPSSTEPPPAAAVANSTTTNDNNQAPVVTPLINSFSVVPPLIVQRKDGPSDLQSGTGSRWRGLLRDSTVERIKRDEGSWDSSWEDTYDQDEGARTDPALKLRCGSV